MAQAAAILLLLLGLLPIANWIPGGHEAPWYAERLRLWTSGGAIVIGVAMIVAIAVGGIPELWRAGAWSRIAGRWRGGGRRADAAIAFAAALLYAVVSRVILSAKPLLIDELIQLYQARIFAAGRLWAVAPPFPEFTSSMHLLDWGGKVYGQFPAGGPAMLAIGTLFHVEWLVGPLAAALGVYAFARLLRLVESRDGVALAALLLLAFAPFCVFLDGSMMNHVTETTWLLVAALGLSLATRTGAAAPWAALAMGLALGVAATIRPLDAASFALPAAAWLTFRALRGGMPHLRALLLSGVGVAIPIAALLAVNMAQNGNPFEFGYITMWGKSHALGFHEAPWGVAHTPIRGLELVNLYLLRLQSYFLETPLPSLLFATGALALARKLSGFDRWVLAGSGLLLLSYFAYWHDGFYLGPRFMLPLTPWLALWTARFPAALAERHAPLPVQRAVVAAGITALLMGVTMLVPLRAQQYRNGMLSMRFDVDALAWQAGVRGSVVLVRESWGAELMARMWGLGVRRVDADHIYRRTDACRMQEAIVATDREHGDAADFVRHLAAEPGDSAKLMVVRSLPDTTVRFEPGRPLSDLCARRLAEDQAGFTPFTPFLLVPPDGNVYVRDLHARDSLILAQYPDRPVWLVTQDPKIGGSLRFERVSVDSMRNEWGLGSPVRP